MHLDGVGVKSLSEILQPQGRLSPARVSRMEMLPQFEKLFAEWEKGTTVSQLEIGLTYGEDGLQHMTLNGEDVTEQYRRGAEAALRLCRMLGCEAAILKERSPSCGHGTIYDGTFTGTLTDGDGVTAELLLQNGIPVYGESQAAELL